jgi:hypothetical protein
MLENKTKMEAFEALTVPCFHAGQLSDHTVQWPNRSLDVARSFHSCHRVPELE